MTRITIAIGANQESVQAGTRKIDAHVEGDWAAHPAVNHCDGWAVTHVPTGMSLDGIAGGLAPGEAVGIARALRSRIPTVRVTNAVATDVGARVTWAGGGEDPAIIKATVAEYLAEGYVL